MKKFFKTYFWCLGVILIVAGLVATFLSPSSTGSIIPIILLITGMVIIISWLIYITYTASNFWQKRSTQTGTNSFISTISFILIIALLNFITFRYSFSLDLTETKVFTLSPETVEIVEKLSQPLKIWIFEDRPLDISILKEYSKYNKNFQFELIDPNEEIGLAEKFNVQHVGDVFIEYKDKKEPLTSLGEAMQLTEIELTNGISKILQNDYPIIYFVQGHGEASLSLSQGGISQAATALQGLGYKINPLILASDDKVPDDADVVIIAGAERKLLDTEIKLIQDYVDRGGNLLLMVEPDVKTGLETVVEDWGVELNTDIVILDTTAEKLDTPIVSFYGDHPITESFDIGISIYDLATPIGTIPVENVDSVSLIATNDQTWGVRLEDLKEETEAIENLFNSERSIPGSLDLGVALTRINSEDDEITSETEETSDETTSEDEENSDETTSEDEENSDENTSENEETSDENTSEDEETSDENTSENQESSDESTSENEETSDENTSENQESRMIVFGDSTFATDGWFETQLNGDLFLNSVKWLVNDPENPLSIRPKQYQNRRLNITTLTSTIITLLALVLFPLFGVILSIFTWWKKQ